MARKARILFYDIETTPMLGWTYKLWDTNIIDVKEHSYMMCFSYKWSDESKVHNVSLPDFKQLYAKEPRNDKMLTSSLWKLLDEADIVVGHNANGFDNKVANTRFIVHDMTTPSPYKTVDTLQMARRVAKFPSNSLDNLCKQLGIGAKSDTKHGDLWQGCINGDKKSWKLMSKYCNMDVILLEKLYQRLLPHMNSHPNLAVLNEEPFACPWCASKDIEWRGYRYTNTSTFRKGLCHGCGHWPSKRISEKDVVKANYVTYK